METGEERLEIIVKQPNGLFEKWLTRWLEEAERRNSKSTHKLRIALQSLRAYPLPLANGRECAVLRGFGATLCNLIDKELSCLQQSDGPKHTMPAFQKDVETVVETVKKSRQAATSKPAKLTKKAQKAIAEEEERQREVTMTSGSFRIVLLVDIQETSGKNKRTLDQTRSYLESLGIEYEVRRLTIGDFLWIARDVMGNELVLPYICERKRMDDLASSIRDGRFHEQKHRLKQCGLQHIIYLIEDYGDNEHVGLPLDNLYQAMANTQIQSKFLIVRTTNHWRSMVYLKSTTRALIKLFKHKMLVATPKEKLITFHAEDEVIFLMKFRELYEDSARNAQLNVLEVFVQQLLQLHSLSLERAIAIVDLYPTPRLLMDAYDACNNELEARKLLSQIGAGSGALKRPIGDKISEQLYEFYKTEFK